MGEVILEVCRKRRNCKLVVSESRKEDGQISGRKTVQQLHRAFQSKINVLSGTMTAGFPSWTPFMVLGMTLWLGISRDFIILVTLPIISGEQSPK